MIGNDLVDLKVAAKESNWRRKGYLQKICTKDEIEMINSSANPDSMLWRLWSMKESVYKVVVRLKSEAFYAPSKLKCSILDESHGLVCFEDKEYTVETKIEDDCLHSYTSNFTNEVVKQRCFKLKNKNAILISEECKSEILDYVNSNFDEGNFQLVKNKLNIPELYNASKNVKMPISISHHGRYGAFVMLGSWVCRNKGS